MTEYVGQKPLFDQYLELKAENERLRNLVSGLPKCCTCGGIIKPEQGGQCMPCLGEETLPDSAQETPAVRTFTAAGPEQGMSTMCECGQTFAKHIAQDSSGNACVCP